MFDVIIAANGKSERAGTDKLSAYIGDGTVLSRTVNAFSRVKNISKIILVTDSPFDFAGTEKVRGGSTRAASVKSGLLSATAEYVLIHDGARPFVSQNLIERVMEDTEKYGSSVPYLPVTDSLRRIKNGMAEYAERNDYVRLQTPQGFARADIARAYELSIDGDYHDDSELYSHFIRPAHLTEGETENKKITSRGDLFGYNAFIGCGFDVHRFSDGGRPLTLGGIKIPCSYKIAAHSDGDVLLHALADAILSCAHERDIGVLFPDTDERYDSLDSSVILAEAKKRLDTRNKKINCVSAVIMAETPKLAPYIRQMETRIAELLDIPPDTVGVSATTTETLGIVGEKKGIAVLAEISVY
jgi:2-C-methyl-D-erythritol 4-phosphate cytidylyltransferase/2-C-methyl-D-erythritol 2,4-cyclodiphosphate synthase